MKTMDVTSDKNNNLYVINSLHGNTLQVLKLDVSLNAIWNYRNLSTYFASTKHGENISYNIKLDSKNNIYIYGGNNYDLNVFTIDEKKSYKK